MGGIAPQAPDKLRPCPDPRQFFVLKVVSRHATPQAQLVYQIEVASFNGCSKFFFGYSPTPSPDACQFWS